MFCLTTKATLKNGDWLVEYSMCMVPLALVKCFLLRVRLTNFDRDKRGVRMMVLSITSPGCQGEADQKKSEALGKHANDYMADIVCKNLSRFQGCASVRMHDPAEAAEELIYSRCEKAWTCGVHVE